MKHKDLQFRIKRYLLKFFIINIVFYIVKIKQKYQTFSEQIPI